jgi:hypothetical protein
MTVAIEPDYAFPVGTVGQALLFPIQVPDEQGQPMLLPHPTSATVTWITPDGTQRLLSCVVPGSAVFAWVTSANEFRTPHTEIGRLKVSTISGQTFYGALFTLTVTAQF